LLYLGFIECIRNISLKNKTHGLLCLKLWHEYYNQTQEEVKGIAKYVIDNMHKMTQEVKNALTVFQEEQKKIKFKDLEVIKLKADFQKSLELLELSSRLAL
jgi:hypothetical protein